jgi:hypothetical protein
MPWFKHAKQTAEDEVTLMRIAGAAFWFHFASFRKRKDQNLAILYSVFSGKQAFLREYLTILKVFMPFSGPTRYPKTSLITQF